MFKKFGILGLCMMLFTSILLVGCGESMPYSDLDLSEYLKVGDYKGIEAEKVSVKVTKSDLADAINEALEAAAEDVDVEKGEEVKDGDTVNIDYEGKVDGETFDGGTAEGQDLTLGSGSYIDGFEDGLVGHTVGEKNIELNLAFPLDYSEESLQGKDVVFTVTINSATRSEEPEYNNKFAKSQGDYKTTEEYEKALKKSLYKEKKEEAEDEQADEIWSEVLENTEVKKYPKEMVSHYVEIFDAQIDYYAEQYGMEREDLIAQYYGAASEESLKKQLKDYARTLVKQEMLIEYIAEEEGLSYTDEEKDEEIENLETQGYTDETCEQMTGRNMEQYVHINLLYDKVKDFLVENADIK